MIQVYERLNRAAVDDRFHLGQRSIHQLGADLEALDIVDTLVESSDDGRVKHMAVTFDYKWVNDDQ